jgi:hypothetical protein
MLFLKSTPLHVAGTQREAVSRKTIKTAVSLAAPKRNKFIMQ